MNRFLLTLLIILLFSGLANAQFSKGSLLVGGELSYSENSYSASGASDQNTHTGVFNLSLGKAVNKNTVLGINLTYSGSKQTTLFVSKGNFYGIGIFYRKYKSLGKDFYLFGEAGAGYTYIDQKGTDNTGVLQLSQSGYSLRIYITPGIAYQVSKKLFLEISIPAVLSAQFTSSKNYNFDPAQVTAKSNSFDISTSLEFKPAFRTGHWLSADAVRFWNQRKIFQTDGKTGQAVASVFIF